MYKVFFNNKLIKLTTELSNSTDEVPLFFIKYISAEEIIRALKSKHIKLLFGGRFLGGGASPGS